MALPLSLSLLHHLQAFWGSTKLFFINKVTPQHLHYYGQITKLQQASKPFPSIPFLPSQLNAVPLTITTLNASFRNPILATKFDEIITMGHQWGMFFHQVGQPLLDVLWSITAKQAQNRSKRLPWFAITNRPNRLPTGSGYHSSIRLEQAYLV